MRFFIFISFLGLILSITATVYATERYLVLLQEGKIIEAMASGDDVMTPKIAAMLRDQVSRDMIQIELSARWKYGALLHSSMAKMNTNATKNALDEVILWLGSSLIFVVLSVGLELFRRKNISKVTM